MDSRETLKHKILIQQLMAQSELGTCTRAKVGCLIVRDGRIIATGFNGSPPGEPHCIDVGCQMEDGHCVRTTHAETNAIAFAARYGPPVNGADLWVYGWHGGICHRCKKIAQSAGIRFIHQVFDGLPIVTISLKGEVNEYVKG